MKYAVLLTLTLWLASCASFDRTNLLPGRRVHAPGISIIAPTEKPWFAVQYGSGHRMQISQLNDKDSYSLQVLLNRGPAEGMYKELRDYLNDFSRYRAKELLQFDLAVDQHDEHISDTYPNCIEYSMSGRDWRGRNNPGYATVEQYGLTCIHPGFENVLVTIELKRRSEADAPQVNVAAQATALFTSIEFEPDSH